MFRADQTAIYPGYVKDETVTFQYKLVKIKSIHIYTIFGRSFDSRSSEQEQVCHVLSAHRTGRLTTRSKECKVTGRWKTEGFVSIFKMSYTKNLCHVQYKGKIHNNDNADTHLATFTHVTIQSRFFEELKSCSVVEQVLRLLQNCRFHYLEHKSPPFATILSFCRSKEFLQVRGPV